MRRTVLRPRKLETGTHRVPVSNARRSNEYFVVKSDSTIVFFTEAAMDRVKIVYNAILHTKIASVKTLCNAVSRTQVTNGILDIYRHGSEVPSEKFIIANIQYIKIQPDLESDQYIVEINFKVGEPVSILFPTGCYWELSDKWQSETEGILKNLLKDMPPLK